MELVLGILLIVTFIIMVLLIKNLPSQRLNTTTDFHRIKALLPEVF
jgi:hypothetical protein